MKKSFSFPIIFMIVITAFFTFILAFLNYSTAEKIEFNKETELRKKILSVFNIDAPLDDSEAIEKIFNDRISEEIIGEDVIYSIKENGEVTGYAFPVSGPGLWGSIEGYAGVTADYTKMIGLDFVFHSETPGLGGRISEDSFKDQFRGLDISNVKDGNYIIYRPTAGGNADAITGATLTSKSVSNFVNEDMHNFINERKGE